MQQEADDRKNAIKQLELEDKQAKELKMKKKAELRGIIEKDKDAKN
jgi:hypothetical protein